jgi:hypothetical protein
VEDIDDDVLLELLDLELVLLLVLLLELEVKDFVDKVLAEAELGLVFREIVVGVLKITSVIPEMTVVKPDNENAEFTGTVASPVKITSVMPLITVTKPGIDVESWRVVAEGMIRKGVPLMVVVTPLIPGGALASGI